MLKELLSVFTGGSPFDNISDDFRLMLKTATGLVLRSSDFYWERSLSPKELTAIYKEDVKINRLERSIRKKLVAHLAVRGTVGAPFCLTIMSLVKDVERLGDYAKNLVEVAELVEQPFPDDAIVAELRELRVHVESLATETTVVFTTSDRERATELTTDARSVAKRCDDLIRKIARSDYSADIAVTLTLGTRFYKRFEGHLLNVLSSVIMPLHKLDYFDEKQLPSDLRD